LPPRDSTLVKKFLDTFNTKLAKSGRFKGRISFSRRLDKAAWICEVQINS